MKKRGESSQPDCEKRHFLHFALDNHPQMQYTRDVTFNGCQRGTRYAIQEGAKAGNALVPFVSPRPALKSVACAAKIWGIQRGLRSAAQVNQVGKGGG
jgi:hypothetical protein